MKKSMNNVWEKVKRMLFVCVCAAVYSVGIGDAAHGDVITQTHNEPGQVLIGPVASGPININSPTSLLLPYDQFDSNQGVLNSVTWTYQFDFNIAAFVAPDGGGFSGTVSGNFYLDPLQDAGAGAIHFHGGGNGGGPPGSNNAPFSVSGVVNFTEAGLGAPNFDFFSNPGGGSHRIEWDLSLVNLTGGELTQNLRLELVNGTSTLEFDFTPVPEPSSILLVGAISALALVARRRSLQR